MLIIQQADCNGASEMLHYALSVLFLCGCRNAMLTCEMLRLCSITSVFRRGGDFVITNHHRLYISFLCFGNKIDHNNSKTFPVVVGVMSVATGQSVLLKVENDVVAVNTASNTFCSLPWQDPCRPFVIIRFVLFYYQRSSRSTPAVFTHLRAWRGSSRSNRHLTEKNKVYINC